MRKYKYIYHTFISSVLLYGIYEKILHKKEHIFWHVFIILSTSQFLLLFKILNNKAKNNAHIVETAATSILIEE